MKSKVEICVCDRCEVTINEAPIEPVAAVDDELGKELILFRVVGKLGTVDFQDLCEKCTERVANLVDQITKRGRGRHTKESTGGEKAKAKGKQKNNKSTTSTVTDKTEVTAVA